MKLIFKILLVFLISIPAFGQDFQVLPVPYRAHDPSIPHPTYSGRKTILKAVVRSNSLNDMFYYRWDADGDGTWDELGGTMADPVNKWYRGQGRRIEGWYNYPEIEGDAEKKIIIARLELCRTLNAGQSVNPVYATYRLIQYKGIPAVSEMHLADDDQLEIYRQVVIDELLWGIHKSITGLNGIGTVDILGYLASANQTYHIGTTALGIMAMLNAGHRPAYPPDSYTVYSQQPYEGFIQQSDFHYATDPYSEDLLRLLNYLVQRLNPVSVAASAEADDGNQFIAGTNDLSGYCIYAAGNHEVNEQVFAAIALAQSGLYGTEIQFNDVSQGQSWEFAMQQLVDYIVDNQTKVGINTGGWSYSKSGSTSIAYQSGGWIYALQKIMEFGGQYGVYVNNSCRTNMVNILKRYQNPDGGAMKRIDFPGESFFEASALMFNACRSLGWDQFSDTDNELIGPSGMQITKGQAREIYNKYSTYLVNNWTKAGGTLLYDPDRALWTDGNYNSNPPVRNLWTYSIFFTAAGAFDKPVAIDNLGSHNLALEFLSSIVKDHEWDFGTAPAPYIYEGYISGVKSIVGTYYGSYLASSGLAANTLSMLGKGSGLYALPLGSVNEVLEGCAGETFGRVEFSHSQSYSDDARRRIVDYQWIFKSDGSGEDEFNAIDWSSIPENTLHNGVWHSSEKESSIIFRYMQAGDYSASLRVVNDASIPETDIASVNIQVKQMAEYDPVADAGGPYSISEGEDLVLNGNVTDPNQQCSNETHTVVWQLENNQILGSASGTVNWAILQGLGVSAGNTYNLEMDVTDETARSDSENTSLTVSVATSEDQISAEEGLILYPNPAGDYLKIKAGEEFAGEIMLRVVNSIGKRIIEKKIFLEGSEYTLDIADLAPGLYIIKLNNFEKSTSRSFIIGERD